jgi:hypothetical protein
MRGKYRGKKIFGSKRQKKTEAPRPLYSEELHDLYASPNIVRVMRSRTLRWEEHSIRKGQKKIVENKTKGTV